MTDTFNFHFHVLEKEMATHPRFLPGESQGQGSLAGLPSLGLHRVRHDCRDLAAAEAAGDFKLSRILPLTPDLLTQSLHCHRIPI